MTVGFRLLMEWQRRLAGGVRRRDSSYTLFAARRLRRESKVTARRDSGYLLPGGNAPGLIETPMRG